MSRALWTSGYTLTVEAAFSAATGTYGVWDSGLWDTATWGPDIVWSDVTADLFRLTTKLGRLREDGHYKAASGVVVLDNPHGNYTPENLSGAYVSAGVTGVRPGRPIRGYVTRDSDGVRFPLFYGTIDDFDETIARKRPAVTFQWVDGIATLSAVDGYEQALQGESELVGQRLHRILDNADWEQGRAIDVGETTLQGTTLARPAWAEALIAADSEGGEIWVDAEGTFVFQDRLAPLRNSRSTTVQYTFTDAAGGLAYEDITLANGMDVLVNHAALARAGGTVQLVQDLTSRALYGLRRWGRNDLICEGDSQVNALAEYLVARRKDPTRRPRSITLNPRVLSALWPAALGLQLWDRVEITRKHEPTSTTITHQCFVDGIEHTVTDNAWITVVRLASTAGIPRADQFGVWDTSLWDSAYWGIS